MRRSDFAYDLPPDLIAQFPAQQRSDSRLLDLGAPDAALTDRRMLDLPDQLAPGDLLIFNDTRVIPARLIGRKPSGGRVEMLIERVLDDREALAQVGASKTPKPGSEILVEDRDGSIAHLTMLGRDADLFHLRLESDGSLMQLLDRVGRLPLPPYIEHAPEAEDRERYQTFFAAQPGAVAAPTAGLHFDERLLQALRERGVRTATLTLHVGAGTFQPLRVDELSEHRMHAERYSIDESLCADIERTRAAGGRVIAVGTTVTRALESAVDADGRLLPGSGETRLFILPGYRFKVVDRLLTNFHLPESTLLMLVCAFGGYDRMLAAYAHAVEQRYRFFSYGDAMLITRA